MVLLAKTGPVVFAGINNHPGATGQIRVDSNPAISYTGKGVIDPTVTRVLVEQMKNGKIGLSRYVAWPNKTHTFEFNLDGFKEAYEELEQMHQAHSMR